MPGFTQPDGFIHEVPGDQPLISITGGPSGTFPILAEQMQAKFAQVEGTTIAGIDTRVGVLEALGLNGSEAQTLATIDSGSGTNTTEFTNIPQDYRDLVIHWTGASDGSGEIDSLALRFNGDDGDEYVSRFSRNEADGTYSSPVGDPVTGLVFSVMRAGHVGTAATRRSGGTVWIPDYSRDGVTKTVHGISISRGQGFGDNVFNTQVGGTWTGTSPINAVRIWVSGQLWSVHPHITLIGFR